MNTHHTSDAVAFPQRVFPCRLPLAALMLLTGIFGAALPAAAAVNLRSSSACLSDSGNVATLTDAITCGNVSGSARMLYYSTHNAYFSKSFNQDTVSYGGFVKYQTAPLYGFTVGVSGIFLRGIDHPDQQHVIADIGDNQTNVGEAYLRWQYEDWRITAGNQRLDLPFLGDYDFRITPMLYQAVDVHYGSDDDFLHATNVWRFKSFGSERVRRTTNYTGITEPTSGMWALGAGHHLQWQNEKLTGQLWYQNYNDFSKLFYTEGHINWQQTPLKPDLALQFIRGTREGKALLGEVDNRTIGAQLTLLLSQQLRWSLGYDHVAANGSSYGYGSLAAPYAENTASGPYFAQPYFTSTQDLGSGDAWATDLTWTVSEHLTTGGRYSWMDLTPAVNSGSRRQSEYMGWFAWNFDGALTGLSLADFFGVQTSPLYESRFWQNRLALEYSF